MNAKTMLSSLLLFAASSQPTWADDAAAACAPAVRDGWIRLTPAEMPMHAGFGTLENRCPAPAAVVAASSPAYAGIELHESLLEDGVSKMRPVPRLQIPAGAEVVLKPGGLHLMLMQPRASLQPGEQVQVELTLADGRKIQGRFSVRAAADRASH